jgi:hypothetical protein
MLKTDVFPVKFDEVIIYLYEKTRLLEKKTLFLKPPHKAKKNFFKEQKKFMTHDL